MEINLYNIVVENFTEKKSHLISDLSVLMKKYFKNKNYGVDLVVICVGFILVYSRPGYEKWHQAKKPKYIDYKITKSKLIDGTHEVSNTFVYEIKFNDSLLNEFVTANDTVSKRILAYEILNSLSNLENLPKKVKDFDKLRFKLDIELFFREQKIIN